MRNTLGGSRIERGRKNLRNIKKQVVRKPAMLAQTILRLILLTGGSGVLSTMFPAGGVLAIAGSGCLTGVDTAGGAPAGTVSPGFGVAVEVLLADDSGGVSTIKPSVGFSGSDTLQRCSRVGMIQIPAMQGLLSAHNALFVYTLRTTGQSKVIKLGAVRVFITFFSNWWQEISDFGVRYASACRGRSAN